MIKHKRIGGITAAFMAAAVLLLCLGALIPHEAAEAKEPLYAAVMDKTKVLSIEIMADEKDWAAMLQSATEENYIPATVVINGVKLETVGIRPKGNSSLSMVARDSTTDRYSFKIEFDHYIKGQTFLGLDKLVVNNMQGDSTYMKEYLSYDIMAYAGVKTPLYAFSSLSVNGEAWGFYLAVEALEDSFSERVYGSDHGMLYKPESMGMRGNGQMDAFLENMEENDPAIDAPTPGARAENGGGFARGGFGGQGGGASLQYTDDELSSYAVIFENSVFKSTASDHRRVVNALKRLDAGVDLESAVDVEATLRYFAAHTVLVNLDSYVSSMCHNYYLYEKDGRLTMLPWDFNLAFGGFQSGSTSSIVNFPIDTPVSGVSLEERPMLAKLLEVEAYKELYHGYLAEIVEGYLNEGLFEKTIDALDASIASYVENDPSAFYDYASYQSGVSALKELGALRLKSIEGQLNGSIPSTTAGQSAASGSLIDASGIELSALGSMGGGGGDFGAMQGEGGSGAMQGGGERAQNRGPMGGGMQGFDRENMEKAMEIVRAAGEGALTEEQLTELATLGFTEEQIQAFLSMGQGGFPRGGGPGRQGEGEGENAGGAPFGQSGSRMPASSVGTGSKIWVLAVFALLMAGGLAFVRLYKRRRA